jgi:subtilisin family serine protease
MPQLPAAPQKTHRAKSPTAKRYLIASRVAPSLDAPSHAVLDMFAAQRPTPKNVKRTLAGRRVMHMEASDAYDLKRHLPHLILEEDRELRLHGMPGLPQMVVYEGRYPREIQVVDSASGAGVEGASIYGLGQRAGYSACTDASGRTILETQEPELTRIIVSPKDTYWSRVLEPVPVDSRTPIVVALDRLPIQGQYSWGPRLMQFDRVHPYYTGRGVRVAVIDSGVSDQLGDFQPAGGWNTLDGGDPRAWNVDEKGHGTHCSGIVGAGRVRRGLHGGAPGAQIYSIKVFPGGYLSDLVEGVEWCIQNGIDVLNVSLGTPAASEILEIVLRQAWNRGLTVIAAAGNDSMRVSFPAAYPTSIAVSAIGCHGTFPADSSHRLNIGQFVDHWGVLFSTVFSNMGPEIAVLTTSARDLGMPRWIQGAGLPTAPAILATAAAMFSWRLPWTASGDFSPARLAFF